MTMTSPIVGPPSFGRWFLVLATLAMVFPVVEARVPAQETEGKTVGEHIKEYWEKLLARAEATSRATGEEYHKLKDEAARASGPAREKMAAKMEAAGRKWAFAREKLAAGLELRMHSLGEEIRTLEEKTAKASGPAHEKMVAEREKLHEQWLAARAKVEATLSSNLESSREQFGHLKEHVAGASEEARARIAPRLERLKAEYHRDREKLTAFLEADLKRTKEDMEKLREATSDAARHAREALSKKAHSLAAKLEELTKEKPPEDSQ